MDKDKEEKERIEKEEKDMQTALKKEPYSFSDFVHSNKDAIRKAVDPNSPKNSEGLTVITKGDPWRDESEWNQSNKDATNK